jgi:hypothetical protein
MSTSISIHGDPGASLAVQVRNWGTYISVQISFGRDTIILYPNAEEGETVSSLTEDILESLQSPTTWSQ